MIPDPVGGADGRREAARELAKEIYHRDDPSSLQRVVNWAEDRLDDLLGKAVGAVSHGVLGPVVVLLVIAAVLVAIVRATGTPPVRDLLGDRNPPERRRTAADERAEAARLAAAGEHDEAIRCTTRALVRELEDRGVLEPRPGRTPRRIAAEVAEAVPAVAADTRLVTDAFEEVWYGSRPGTPALWESARAAEARVRSGRLVVTA